MERKQSFFSSTRKYFIASCNYMVAKFPLHDEVLRNARVANPAKRLDMTYSSVAFFNNKFQLPDIDQDELEVEFASYQIDGLDSINLNERADSVWAQISSLKDRSTSHQKYPNLSRIMLTILTLEHSNATDERTFSLVRKNATVFRPSLSTQTLSDFLTQKVLC